MKNVKLAKIVKEKLKEKENDISFEKILADVDMTFDDNAKESDIQNIVESYLAEYEYKNESFRKER